MTRADAPNSPASRGAASGFGPEDRDRAAGRVLPALLGDLRREFVAREPGVLADVDIEALHQYRVTVRRARSLVRAGRGVFPSAARRDLRRELSRCAALTSPVRDLDVLLEDLDAQVERLSPELRAGAPSLRARLVEDRADAFGALREGLLAASHAPLLRDWQRLSRTVHLGAGGLERDALTPVGAVADRMVWHSFRAARAAGARARSTDEREAWHDLRKELKQFRYVIAAVRPLYAPGTFAEVRARLPRLQDALGELQDRHVQADLIAAAGRAAGGDAALTAGALADRLHSGARSAQHQCRSAWRHFDRPRVRRELRDELPDLLR